MKADSTVFPTGTFDYNTITQVNSINSDTDIDGNVNFVINVNYYDSMITFGGIPPHTYYIHVPHTANLYGYSVYKMTSCTYTEHYIRKPASDSMSFAQYLSYLYGATVTDSQVNFMITKCNCDTALNPYSFNPPPQMMCPKCIGCDALDSGYAAFYRQDSYFSSADSANPYYQRSVQNFLNKRFSYNFTYLQYKNFHGQCHSADTGRRDSLLVCGDDLIPTATIDTPPCKRYLLNNAKNNAQIYYTAYMDSFRQAFKNNWMASAYAAAGHEKFMMQYPDYEYHYTLYYYDQAGNLVKTVPPEGVVPITDTAILSQVRTRRKTGLVTVPQHKLITQYRYNSLNQVWWQKTPDAGISTYRYDKLGRLCASQSARQKYNEDINFANYSYTRYDILGRINEVGSIQYSFLESDFWEPLHFDSIIALETTYDVTHTFYDTMIGHNVDNGYVGQNLRGRVTGILTDDNVSGLGDLLSYFNTATLYSYDEHGNVQLLTQKIMDMDSPVKRIYYGYDLVSGKVNTVDYQPGMNDQWHHRYEYDADNRLTNVYTSPDSIIWDQDAKYFYYLHGPLAREEIGDAQVQGLDYAYTIQGWIKGVNSNTLQTTWDMGQDGNGGSINQNFASDVFGYTLNYYHNDYKAIGGSQNFEAAYSGSYLDSASKNLYNGNIRHSVMAISKFLYSGLPQASAYKYDQLNRLMSVETMKNINVGGGGWQNTAPDSLSYNEKLTYDGMGNILTNKRNGNILNSGNPAMDRLAYHYYPNTNRLAYVGDSIPANWYKNDLDNESSTTNYVYDSSGNLIYDASDTVHIYWNTYGKIDSVVRPHVGLAFMYDGGGNRIEKTVRNNGLYTTTWYVRDAQGNVIAEYEHKYSVVGVHLSQNLDYDHLLPSLYAHIGHDSLRNFLYGFYNTDYWFQNLIFNVMQASDSEWALIKTQTSLWYAQNDPYVATTVQSYFTDNWVGEAVMKYDSSIILNYMLSSSQMGLFTNCQLGLDCYNYLLLLDTIDGAHNLLNSLYAAYVGTPIGSKTTMAATLCGMGGMMPAFATFISSYDAGGGIQYNTALTQYNSTQLITIMESCGSFGFARSYLNSLYNILDILYAEQKANFDFAVFSNIGYEYNYLTDYFTFTGPTTFVWNALTILNWNGTVNMVPLEYFFNASGYPYSNFQSDVQSFLASNPTLYNEILEATADVTEYIRENLSQTKLYIYGSGRLGEMNINRIYKQNWTYSSGTPGSPPPFINRNIQKIDTGIVHYCRIKGERNYELCDWRGNVNVVITDRRTLPAGSDVVSATDYYAFGSEQPGRVWSAADSSKATHGFDGQMRDDEVYGDGNLNTAEFWEYDSRLGRRWNLDPKYPPYNSPYACFNNNPILLTDVSGDTTHMYDLSGHFIKTIPDNLSNAIVFIDNDIGKGLATKDANAISSDVYAGQRSATDVNNDLGKAARNSSKAVLTQKTMNDIKAMAVKTDQEQKEGGFVLYLNKNKELVLYNLNDAIDAQKTGSENARYQNGINSDYYENAVNSLPADIQNNIVALGHTHPAHFNDQPADKRNMAGWTKPSGTNGGSEGDWQAAFQIINSALSNKYNAQVAGGFAMIIGSKLGISIYPGKVTIYQGNIPESQTNRDAKKDINFHRYETSKTDGK